MSRRGICQAAAEKKAEVMAEAIQSSEQYQRRHRQNHVEQPPETSKVGNATLELWEAIASQGLQPYVGELDVKGYTVIPPEVAKTDILWPVLLDTVLDVAKRRNGTRPDILQAADNKHGALGTVLSYLLFEDDAFCDLLLNDTVQTVLTYMCGANAILSSMQAQIKAAGDADLTLHADNVIFGGPFPHHYPFCNISINLTEYGPGFGPVCFVPGSHKLFRHPAPGEGWDERVGVSAAPGSIIAFTGNTWHSAFSRQAPGLRVSLLMQFVRPQVRPFEAYRENVSPELVSRKPERFARLMGLHTNHGWTQAGPRITGNPYNMGSHAYD